MSLDDQNMTLTDHLRDLRYRLLRAIYGIIIGMGISLYFSEHLLAVIRAPVLPHLQGGLVFTGVLDKFMAHIKIGLLGGIILSCPYWLYHLWKFISPGLYEKERKFAVGFIVSGTILFGIGVCFVYFLVLPAAFEFLFNIGGNIDKPMITIDDYLSFFTMTTLMFGLAFEMPLVLVVLAMIGVIDAKFLRDKRRYAIVALSAIAAVITPPDIVSMLMLFFPLLFLYEIAILVIVALGKSKAKAV
jgi:sec-independent protein translocase protein TatC